MKVANKSAKSMTCKELYSRPKEYVWVKLSGCEADFTNAIILTTTVKKIKMHEVLLPIVPKGEEASQFTVPIVAVVKDKEFVKKYIALNQSEENIENLGKLVELVSTYMKDDFTGVIPAISSTRMEGESERRKYYPFNLNEVPEWPVTELGWAILMLLLTIISFSRKNKKSGIVRL